jgi:hypothetical protein
VNTELPCGDAVSVTVEPELKVAEQVAPQLIPAGELVTVPEPVPVLLTERVNVGAGEKVAVTGTAEVPMVKLQVPVPEQAPDQPAKTEPAAGVAVRVIRVLVLKLAEQVAPQLIPAGALLTEPEPVPARVTFTGKAAGMKVALTDWAEFMVTEQAPVPVQAPPQPANTEAAEVGVAVSATTVPWRYVSLQVAPQLIAPGELVTVPEPVPVLLTERVKVGAGEKVAVTGTAEVPMVKLQVPVPEQPAPVQPANTDAEDDGVAVRVIRVLVLKLAEQVAPQLIPAGELLTDPDPVPARVTFTGNEAGMKSALTDCAEFMVTEQAPVPEQAPPQPANTEAAEDGVAVSDTTVPWR